MTPSAFIQKWKAVNLKERSAAQAHFIDLCRLLEEPTPTEYADDPRAQKIAVAAKRLDELRNNWLNPPDLVVRVAEVVEGYPERILPKNEEAARVLK
jgi:hypothetical protein